MNEEEQYQQLRKLGQALNFPVFEVHLELEVRAQDGKVLFRHRQRSHSWTRNAYNWLFSQLGGKNGSDTTFGAGKVSAKDTGGTVRYGDSPYGWFYQYGLDTYGYVGGAGDDSYGIWVGSGTTAESFEDYELATQIANGTGAGQLSYIAGETPVATWTPGTLTFAVEHARYFNNNSGGVVTVNEVALVARLHLEPHTPKSLVSRDKLASGINIPDTGQLKVTYTIQLIYPE